MVKIKISREDFNRMVSEKGYDVVFKELTNNEPNKSLKVHNNYVTIKDLKFKPTNRQQKKIERIKRRKKQRVVKREQFREFAEKLNNELPKSEAWFQSLYKSHFSLKSDQYNAPFHYKYIPDVLNLEFKYVIEVDGSIHNRPDVIKKDIIKDRYLLNKGFKVFRVQAYDNDSYIQLIKDLFIYRRRFSYPTKAFQEYLLTLGYEYSKIGF